MIQRDTNILPRKHEKSILIDVSYDPYKKKQPIVIFCHGYKGFKDWGAWHLVADAFAKSGCFFIKFNFSHNGGTIEQPIDFPDLEAFGNNNYIKELDDLKSVLDWITSTNSPYNTFIDSDKVTVIGHSRGGGIAMIKTSEDPRITRLITWASVCDYEDRFLKGEALENWKNDGIFYVQNGRTKQQMPHYFQFYTSFIEHKERLTIAKAIKKIEVPHLIIHGTTDPTVSSEDAVQLHHWNPKSELFLVDGADHVFGTKHPWTQDVLPSDLANVVEKSVNFTVI